MTKRVIPADHTAALLTAIIESSDDAIVSKDFNGIITSWNRSAERIFGFTAEEAVGQPITLIIPPERLIEEPVILDRIRRGEHVDHFETVRMRKDGVRIFVSVTISPIRNSAGQIVGASKIARDVTEKKRLERMQQEAKEALEQLNRTLEERVREKTAELERSNRELQAFAHTVAHDLRSPLRVIQGFSEILLDDEGMNLSEQGRDHLDRIIRSGQRMTDLITEVLEYSQVDFAETESETVDVLTVVTKIIDESPQLQPPNAEVDVQETRHAIEGHRPLLGQALTNLLNNAVKFVPSGVTPHVRIATEQVADHVRIWVEDNGVGIPADRKEQIWEAFHRLDSSRGGSGIGLSIVRRVVDKMGGTVGVESEEGRGSRFWIQLPAARHR